MPPCGASRRSVPGCGPRLPPRAGRFCYSPRPHLSHRSRFRRSGSGSLSRAVASRDHPPQAKRSSKRSSGKAILPITISLQLQRG
jgi:hypothetical protein